MSVFAVIYRYDHRTEARDAVRPAHRAFLSEHFAAGEILAAGAFAEVSVAPDAVPGGAIPGALLIARADTAAAVAELLDDDPFALHGLIVERSIRPWTQVFGPWAGAPAGSET